MKFESKYNYKDTVYTDAHGKIISGQVSTIRCQFNRLGKGIEYDVWIKDDRIDGGGYYITSDEKYLFPTAKEAADYVQETRNLGGKGNGKA